jgi:predicted dienelactone hydrolase
MIGQNLRGAATSAAYDPFARGPFPAGVRTIHARDAVRNREFPCEIWYPATAAYARQDLAPETQDWFADPPRDTQRSQKAVRNAAAEPGTYPLILFSHSSGGPRRQSTFLCTHLSSHGYVVAALDHSELVAPELARKGDETPGQRAARGDAWIASRVPDIRFLLDHLLNEAVENIDSTRVGMVGHSFGGWTALAAPDVESRIRGSPGFFRGRLPSGGAGMCRRCTWWQRTTFHCRSPGCTNCSKGLRLAGRW